MIRLSEETLRRAFEAFRTRWGEWAVGLNSQLAMYAAGQTAFGATGKLKDFEIVYNELRKWRLFRGGRVKPAEWVYGRLNGLDRGLRQRRLSQLNGEDWPKVWRAIEVLQDVKANKGGPSVMAISKFLHFWNPRLFIICDQQEVEQFVFGHRWLAQQLELAETGAIFQAAGVEADDKGGLSRYLRVLAFGSDFVKANGRILPEFARTVRELADGTALPGDIETYEATAAEWCLIGLAEMPPEGVELTGGRA